MADFLLHKDATVTCLHSGRASPVQTNRRVKVSGNPIVTQASIYKIEQGCTLPPQSGGPCVSATWTSAATRVRAGGRPVLLKSSQATCQPTATGLNVTITQNRVKGS